MFKKHFDTLIELKGRFFRYNSKECLLEFVAVTEFDLDSEELREVKLKIPKVIDSIGLSVENAESSLLDYISQWNDEIEEEIARELLYL